jgi:hypothetical protein
MEPDASIIRINGCTACEIEMANRGKLWIGVGLDRNNGNGGNKENKKYCGLEKGY